MHEHSIRELINYVTIKKIESDLSIWLLMAQCLLRYDMCSSPTFDSFLLAVTSIENTM